MYYEQPMPLAGLALAPPEKETMSDKQARLDALTRAIEEWVTARDQWDDLLDNGCNCDCHDCSDDKDDSEWRLRRAEENLRAAVK